MNPRDSLKAQSIEKIQKFREEIDELFTQLQNFTLSYKENPEIKEEKERIIPILFSSTEKIGQELHDYLENKECNVEPLDAGLDLVKICNHFYQTPAKSDAQRQARMEQAQKEMRTFADKYCLNPELPTQLNLDAESRMLIEANYASPTPSMFKQLFDINIQSILADDPFPRFLHIRTEHAKLQANKRLAAVSETINQTLSDIQVYRDQKDPIEKKYAAKSLFSISRFKHNSHRGKKLLNQFESELMELNKSLDTKYAHEAEQALTSLLTKFHPLLLRTSFATKEEDLIWQVLRKKIYPASKRALQLTTLSIQWTLKNRLASDQEQKPNSTTREKSDSAISNSSTASMPGAGSTSSTVSTSSNIGTPRSSINSNATLFMSNPFSSMSQVNVFPPGIIHKSMSPRTAFI